MDGVDLALVHLRRDALETIATTTSRYPESIRERLIAAITPEHRMTVHEIASLDIEIGQLFAAASSTMLESQGINTDSVIAIGSHGQTLRHHPQPPSPYSWQIGNPAAIAARTGITTVADFRSLDIADGGEGAPLVPPFHRWCFGTDDSERIIANIGGIANISVLNPGTETIESGFDTGPGNCLLDEWRRRHSEDLFDQGGTWASTGTVVPELLAAFISEPYFAHAAPKSTGREMFNMAFIECHLSQFCDQDIDPADIQATIAQLTAETLSIAIDKSTSDPRSAVYVCGGGAHNNDLLNRLRRQLPKRDINTTEILNVDPDYVEATAFAWLAQQRVALRPVTLSTNRTPRSRVLGAIYEPRV